MSLDATVNIDQDHDEISDIGELLDMIYERPAWHADAACREPHPDADWYADGSGPAMTAAMKVCQACLVREECARWALTRPEYHGLWGALSVKQRFLIRKQQRRAGQLEVMVRP